MRHMNIADDICSSFKDILLDCIKAPFCLLKRSNRYLLCTSWGLLLSATETEKADDRVLSCFLSWRPISDVEGLDKVPPGPIVLSRV